MEFVELTTDEERVAMIRRCAEEGAFAHAELLIKKLDSSDVRTQMQQVLEAAQNK